MIRFFTKTIVSTLTIYITAYFFGQITYTNMYYPVLAGLGIAALGMILDAAILGTKKVMVNTVIDIISAFTIMMFVFPLLSGVRVTAYGALIVAIMVGVVEYFYHQHIIAEDNQREA